MNKRIKQLAEQVGAGTPQSLYGRTDYIVMTEFELEKLAQLIVRECADVGFKFSLAHPEDIRYQIKRHFGVE